MIYTENVQRMKTNVVQFCAHQLKSTRDWFLERGTLKLSSQQKKDTLKLASQQRLGIDVVRVSLL